MLDGDCGSMGLKENKSELFLELVTHVGGTGEVSVFTHLDLVILL